MKEAHFAILVSLLVIVLAFASLHVMTPEKSYDKSVIESTDAPTTTVQDYNQTSVADNENKTETLPEEEEPEFVAPELPNEIPVLPRMPAEDQPAPEDPIILYWGDGCPHCETVKEYIKENGVDSKLNIEQKEVYYNQENQLAIQEAAKECGIPSNQIGVPMLYYKGSCYVGDEDGINFLKRKLAEVG